MNIYNSKAIGILIANFNPNGKLSASSQIENVLISNVNINGTVSHGLIALLIDTIMVNNVVVTNAAQENTDINGNCQWGSGLRVFYCREVIIKDCITFQNRGEGIVVSSSSNSLVESCKSYDNFSGNLYCIRSNRAIFKKNLLYNRDSIYWRNCKANQVGVSQVRKPSNGFSISNEVNYDDFFSNACVPERTYDNGLFTNKIADSIFFYNNICILAPLKIIDESNGDCFFPQFSRANNFSNIFIENNTFIGDISDDNAYLNRTPIVSLTFNQAYFWGCFPNVNGVGKYTAENIVLRNNIISLSPFYEEEAINPASVFYGGRPCNGGLLGEKIFSTSNLWHHELSDIWDSYATSLVPNFLFGSEDLIVDGMLTNCDPDVSLETLIPSNLNSNGFSKISSYSNYIQEDFFGNSRGILGLSNVGALESQDLISTDNIDSNLKIKIYPNPASAKTTILLDNISDFDILVSNALGEKQDAGIVLIGENSVELHLNQCSKGLLYIQVKSDTAEYFRKIVRL